MEDSHQGGDARTAPACDKRRAKLGSQGFIASTEDSSIIDVAMRLGSKLFVDSEAGPPKKETDTVHTHKEILLLRDERVLKDLLEGDNELPVLRGQTVAPRLTERQIHQAVAVISADYWNLRCWKCRPGIHSTFSCLYLIVALSLYFVHK